MGKMFTCADGTMFPIDDILSVEEVRRTHTTFDGTKVQPIGLSSVSEAEELAKRANMLLYKESDAGRAVRHFFARLFRKDIIQSDVEKEVSNEGIAYSESIRDLQRFTNGEVVFWNYKYYVLKKWDVRIRNKRATIRISNDDYERLQKVVKK